MDDHYKNQNDKIIALPSFEMREKMRVKKESDQKKMMQGPTKIGEPIINMPPFTKYFLGLILGIYFISSIVLSPEQTDWIIGNFGFIPLNFYNDDYTAYSLVTPFSHMLLHGSWAHVAMNALMLAAFGSGVEKWLGTRRTLILFVASGLFGVLAHFLLNTQSPYPMIGASGGISGLFAAAIVMLGLGQREMGGKFGILPFALIWIGLSIGFGMMGGPGGSIIAWAAHVGGFLGGFVMLKLLRV